MVDVVETVEEGKQLRFLRTRSDPEVVACLEHPGLEHPAIHEAGHAVAAVQRGLDFEDVRIVAPGVRAGMENVPFLGRVRERHPPQVWVEADPVGSFECALAGYVAEEVLLGHHLPSSGDSDIRRWRLGGGFFQANQVDEIESFLGRSAGDILDSMHEWVDTNAAAIKRVAENLKNPQTAMMGSESAEWYLTSPMVKALMNE